MTGHSASFYVTPADTSSARPQVTPLCAGIVGSCSRAALCPSVTGPLNLAAGSSVDRSDHFIFVPLSEAVFVSQSKFLPEYLLFVIFDKSVEVCRLFRPIEGLRGRIGLVVVFAVGKSRPSRLRAVPAVVDIARQSCIPLQFDAGDCWYGWVADGKISGPTDIARRAGVSERYVSRVFPLALLAPDIAQAIVEGRQPEDLTLDKLWRNLPSSWSEHRRVLGFPCIRL
jgi:hypothetical protein